MPPAIKVDSEAALTPMAPDPPKEEEADTEPAAPSFLTDREISASAVMSEIRLGGTDAMWMDPEVMTV